MRLGAVLRGALPVALKGALPIAAVAGPLVMHAALATGRWPEAATALSACQVAAVGLLLLRRSPRGRIAWLAVVVPAYACACWFYLQASLLAVSGVTHALIYGSLLTLFGGTLRQGRLDLVTSLARRLRGALQPEVEAYTRGVTKAWCAFFGCQLATSLLLGLFAPAEAWSLFINVLDAPLVALMFLSEFAVRRIRFPGHDHAGIAETVRAFGQQATRPRA